MGRPRGFTRAELTEAVRSSRTASETLRKLGLRPAGGNFGTLRKYAALWGISTEHFDPAAVILEHLRAHGPTRPLEELLVSGSLYSRNHLKARLFAEGIKERRCELCGQGEIWRGATMGLILDHVNGVPDDNRLLISGGGRRRRRRARRSCRRHVVLRQERRAVKAAPCAARRRRGVRRPRGHRSC